MCWIRLLRLTPFVCLAVVTLLLAACGGEEAKVVVPVAVDVDTVTAGPGEAPVDADSVCTQRNVFKRGMRVVFRMSARDTVTGEALAGPDVSAAVLRLPGGDELPFVYGKHGEGDALSFWTAAWDVPQDYPLGTVDVEIVVTPVDGDPVSWKQPRPVPPTLLQIVA